MKELMVRSASYYNLWKPDAEPPLPKQYELIAGYLRDGLLQVSDIWEKNGEERIVDRKPRFGVCQCCLIFDASEKHRWRPGMYGGTYEPENVRMLCEECHRPRHGLRYPTRVSAHLMRFLLQMFLEPVFVLCMEAEYKNRWEYMHGGWEESMREKGENLDAYIVLGNRRR